ncbi:MAG: DUF6263 family protein [Planctomycetota bacterium]
MIRNSLSVVMLFLTCVCNAARLGEGAALATQALEAPSRSRVGGELQFRFKQGDKFSLVSVNETKTDQLSPEPDSGEQVEQQTLRLRCDLDVEEVEPDGCAWAKYTYRQVALKVRGKDADVDYDSDANQLPTGRDRRAGIPLKVLPFYLAIGESFFVRVTPQGRITNVNGLSAVVGNAKSKFPNVAIKDQLIQVIDRQFAEDKIRRSLEGQLAVFPDANSGPIGIGDTWSSTQRADEDRVATERTFRLKECRDDVAVVDVNVVVASDANAGPISIGQMKAKSEVSGLGTGQIEIEQSTGRIINSALTQNIVAKITFLPEGVIRRPPPPPAPTRTHIVTTFQMVKRDSDQPPVLSKVEGP